MVLCSVALYIHLTQLFPKLMTACALNVTEESDGRRRKLNTDNIMMPLSIARVETLTVFFHKRLALGILASGFPFFLVI